MTWTRSSHCGTDHVTEQCVEVAFTTNQRTDTVKSSYSEPQENCVDVDRTPGSVNVRDSKHPDGPVLTFTPDEWAAFVLGVKAGEFDI